MSEAKKNATTQVGFGKSKFALRLDESQAFEAYKVVNNVNGKAYIGITTRGVALRWIKHVSDAYNRPGKSVFHKAIRKYGKDSFSVTVVATASDWTSLCALERDLIASNGTYVPNGYNTTRGGEGAYGVIIAGEALENIRAAVKKRSLNPQWRENVIAARNLQWSDPAFRAARVHDNQNMSLEWRAAIAAAARKRGDLQIAEANAKDPAGAEKRALQKARNARFAARRSGQDIPKLKTGPRPESREWIAKRRVVLDAKIAALDAIDPAGAAKRVKKRASWARWNARKMQKAEGRKIDGQAPPQSTNAKAGCR